MKHWKTAEELEQLLAERADVPVYRVSVFGSPENWDATLIAALTGNAERKALDHSGGTSVALQRTQRRIRLVTSARCHKLPQGLLAKHLHYPIASD